MEAQYKLKYALENLNSQNDQVIEKVNTIMSNDGDLDTKYETIFNSVSSYIDDVDEQSRMLHKELGPYRFFHDTSLNSDSAKVIAFAESVELICGIAPEMVPEMLRLVEKMSPNSQIKTVELTNGCILVKRVMRRILPEHQ